MLREKKATAFVGGFMVLLLLVLVVLGVFWMVGSIEADSVPGILGSVFFLVVVGISFFGLSVVNPNEGLVVQFFGTYVGTLRDQGFWFVNPLTTRKRVSLRIRNFESSRLKVNDLDGNPIEIAAVVVWRVVDTAEAVFQVDKYEDFVHVQSEAAVRSLAMTYSYDAHEDGHMSLRGNTGEIAEGLKKEIQARLDRAGVEVLEARISHLAYAPEIASAMLRRQQASAVIAARTRIVEGAVSMVQMALDELNARSVVQLDEERKAAMVSNLLVVLCSDRDTQPVVNTGTLYQ
jgi:regulator of protease activity HflC (stomatin/prohibitin superfamily)